MLYIFIRIQRYLGVRNTPENALNSYSIFTHARRLKITVIRDRRMRGAAAFYCGKRPEIVAVATRYRTSAVVFRRVRRYRACTAIRLLLRF